MSIIIGSLTLPNYTELSEIETPNVSENITMDGTLFVDFVNRRRGWKVKWNLIDIARYDEIKALYNLQFSSGSFNNITISEYGVSNLPAYMKINDKNIKYNGGFVEGFELQLLEQDAI
jgi:hypothetical protein